jgi:cysteine-rich repeat protein
MASPMRACILAAIVSGLALSSLAGAEPIRRARTFYDTDYKTFGAGGIGRAGTATFDVSGIDGPVHTALLYWHGIDQGLAEDASDGVYSNAMILFDGRAVTGEALGDATTNCWGTDGSSRAYVADVSAQVTGDGTYTATGMAAGAGHDVNGASLVVLYHDAIQANDRDLVFFEGNDSNVPEGFPGGDNGWHGTLQGLNYRAGSVLVEMHVADGQAFSDDAPIFTSTAGSLTIADEVGLWDGVSVADMGDSRASSGNLWDIHRFDLTSVFGPPGAHTIELSGMSQGDGDDCLGLVLAIIDLPFGTAPRCGDGLVFYEEQCDDGNTEDGDCCSSTCQFEPAGTVCQPGDDLCGRATCDGAGTCDPLQMTECRFPAAPAAAELTIRSPARAWKRRMTFAWNTGTARLEELGDPAGDTRYQLCLFDRETDGADVLMRMPLGGPEDCGPSCWRTRGRAHRFRSRRSALKRFLLDAGEFPGEARIEARFKGERLKLPALPLSPHVMAQVRSSDGLCVAADFAAPTKNSPRRYESRSTFDTP